MNLLTKLLTIKRLLNMRIFDKPILRLLYYGSDYPSFHESQSESLEELYNSYQEKYFNLDFLEEDILVNHSLSISKSYDEIIFYANDKKLIEINFYSTYDSFDSISYEVKIAEKKVCRFMNLKKREKKSRIPEEDLSKETAEVLYLYFSHLKQILNEKKEPIINLIFEPQFWSKTIREYAQIKRKEDRILHIKKSIKKLDYLYENYLKQEKTIIKNKEENFY